jgi:hypothetical protein
MLRSASAAAACVSMSGSLNVRLWPHSVAIADLMQLPLCADSAHGAVRGLSRRLLFVAGPLASYVARLTRHC